MMQKSKIYIFLSLFYIVGIFLWFNKGFKVASLFLLAPILAYVILNYTCSVTILLPIIVYLPEYKFLAGFSYKVLLITFMAFILLIRKLSAREPVFPPKFLYLISPYILFLAWIFIASLRHYNGFNPVFFRHNYLNLFPQAMMLYMLSVCIDSWRKLEILSLMILIVGIWMSLLGFGEIGGIGNLIHYFNPKLQFLRVNSKLIRASSRFNIPVTYSYTIMMIALFAFVLFLKYKEATFKLFRFIAFLSAVIAFAGLSTAITRSSNLGAVIGIIVPFFFAKLGKHKIIFSVKMLLLFLVIFPVLSIVANYFYVYLKEPNAIGRYTLFISGLKIAAKHPFWGIGPINYPSEAFQFALEAEGLPYLSTAVRTTSHNQFVLIFSFYGLPGLCFLLWFCHRLFNLITKALISSDNRARSWGLSILSVFSAFVFTSGYHNSGFFITHDRLVWIFVAMPLIVLNIMTQKTDDLSEL